MTILDRARDTGRTRIDIVRLADELARRVRELDAAAPGWTSARRGAARTSMGWAGMRARGLRRVAAGSADQLPPGIPFDEIGRRLRAAASSPGVRAFLARVEQEMPAADRVRRAAQVPVRPSARATAIVLTVAAGVTAGVVAAVLLDPRHGKARREAIVSRARLARDRARELAARRGAKTETGSAEAVDAERPAYVAIPINTPAWPSEEGPIAEPLHDHEFGAHEALPEELVSASRTGDPGDPTIHR